jgi:DNA ligase 1
MHISHTFLFRVLCIVALLFLPLCATAQDILLAQIYSQGVDVKQYLVSEKLDGVRAIWDGKQLKSRKGNVINAPVWFVKDLPNTPLDGELWLARGQFDVLSGAVRKDIPVDAEWKNITYQIFELPNATGTFEVRAKRMVEIVEQLNIPHLKTVVQFRVKNETELNKKLKQIVAKGGEGLMLHRADAAYITGRSDALLKLKLLHDAEAIVIAHLPGKGKYTGKLGALLVQAQDGMRFKLGTGFSDAQRANPPEIGSTITYTYLDKTKNGKPKFASFLRVRNEK